MHRFLSGSRRCPRRQPIFCWLDFPSPWKARLCSWGTCDQCQLRSWIEHYWRKNKSQYDINETLMTWGWALSLRRVELCGCLTAQNTDFICFSEMFSAFWEKCLKGASVMWPETHFVDINQNVTDWSTRKICICCCPEILYGYFQCFVTSAKYVSWPKSYIHNLFIYTVPDFNKIRRKKKDFAASIFLQTPVG